MKDINPYMRRYQKEVKTGTLSGALIEDLRTRVREDDPGGYRLFYELTRNRPLPYHCYPWIDAIWEDHAKGERTIIEAFRGATKTTAITETFTAYRIALEPKESNLFVQASDAKAKKHASNVADVIAHNPLFRVLFPDIVPDKEKGWGAEGYWVKDISVPYDTWTHTRDKDPTLVGAGYGADIVVGSHPSGVFIIDDINNDKNTESDLKCQEVNRILTDTLFPMIDPNTWCVFNQTPWNKKDALQLVKDTGVWNLTTTPALTEDPEGELLEVTTDDEIVIYSTRCKLAWPERFSMKVLETKFRESGVVGFARMYLLDLKQAEGQVLKKEWLRYFPYEKIDINWPMFAGLDYASTSDRLKQRDRDYFVLCWGYVNPRGNLIVVDGYRLKCSQADAEQRVIAWVSRQPTLQQLGAESIGKGEEFVELLMRAPVYMPIMPIPSHKGIARSKGGRFEKILAPMFQQGRILLSDQRTPFLDAFEAEWLAWDGSKKGHDDTLDGVYMMTRAAEGFIAVPTMQATTMSPIFTEKKKSINPYIALSKVRG